MCESADLDPCEMWSATTHKARKEHKCDCCHATIKPGETYHALFTVFEGDASNEKACIPCHESAEEFAEGHHQRGIPSYMREMYQACVAESKDEGNDESADHWQAVLDAIKARGE